MKQFTINPNDYMPLPMPAWQKDNALCYIWANPAWKAFAHRFRENWLGLNDLDIFPLGIASEMETDDLYALNNGASTREIVINDIHGRETTLQIQRIPHSDSNGEIIGITALAFDVTYKKMLITQMSNMIAEIESQRYALHRHAIVSITNSKEGFIYVSDPFCTLTGYSRQELLSANRFEIGLTPDTDLQGSLEQLEPLQSVNFTTHGNKKSGEEFWLESILVPIDTSAGKEKTYFEISTDITGRKQREVFLEQEVKTQTEAKNIKSESLKNRSIELTELNEKFQAIQHKLLQSEKLASIGLLSAGIAHEINNPISYVNSNINSLKFHVSDIFKLIESYEFMIASHGNTGLIRQMEHAQKSFDFDFIKDDINSLISESTGGISRVKNIIQDLKSFSRVGSDKKWEYSDLHEGINSTLNIVQNEIKYKAEVIREYGEIPLVYCVISQLNQVFLNMLVNACHAIEKKGKIYIRTQLINNQICISFIDTGKGIKPENMNHIFDPFFTTKPVNQGTGLGLSLSYGIIKEHQGYIEVSSVEEEGTTFKIWLPVSQ